MTTDAERVTHRQSTMDLFAEFAEQMVAGYPEPSDDFEPTVIRATLWCLTNTDDPMAHAVLNAIHAERRRRESAATREERRG